MNAGTNIIREKIIQLLTLSSAPAIIASGIAVILMGVTIFTSQTVHEKAIQQERITSLSNLGIMRSMIEGSLNSRLLLGRGLVSYVSIKPGINAEEFRVYADKLVNADPVIRNISVIKNTTIHFIYPFASNRKAIGTDIAKIPEQRDAVLRVIETGKTAVMANVALVQGGIATICRIPVYTGVPGSYWGQVSIVLMQDELFKESGISECSHGMNILLTSVNGDGSAEKTIIGKNDIAGNDPVVLDVKFPYGMWRLSAVPEKGWGYSDTMSKGYLFIGGLLSLLTGLLLFAVMKLGQRIQQLENILPICSNCKKIRNDKGYWDSVDMYFSSNPAFKFSHGLCPDCMDHLYSEEPWYKKKKPLT